MTAILEMTESTGLAGQNAKQKRDLRIAREVISAIGEQNIVFGQGVFWLWDKRGLWVKVDDREIKKIIHRHVNSEVTKSLVDSILDLVKTETYAKQFGIDQPFLGINCINGELEYTSGAWQLSPHRKDKYRISQVPVIYRKGAQAPRFEQFLHEIFNGDVDMEEKKKIVLEMMGYTLLHTCRYEIFTVLIGGGANGKSVLLSCLESLCGTQNVAAVRPQDFSNRFQRAHLHGKIANIVTEIAEGSEIADAELKAIVSGELLTAEMKFQPPFNFRPYCTCWFGTNHMPRTRDFSDALFRRAKILTFNNTFEGSKRDPHLKEKLFDELEGILNLALDAVVGVIERGCFTQCHSEIDAKEEWRIGALSPSENTHL